MEIKLDIRSILLQDIEDWNELVWNFANVNANDIDVNLELNRYSKTTHDVENQAVENTPSNRGEQLIW